METAIEVRSNGDGLDSKGMEVRLNGGAFSLVRLNSDGGTQIETTSLVLLCQFTASAHGRSTVAHGFGGVTAALGW